MQLSTTWLNTLKVWSKGSANRSILFSAITVGSMTFVVKAAAFAKDVVVANNFGVSKSLDAYLLAFILPSFAINVVAGAFHTSLVPTYIESREHGGNEAAQDVFSAVLARALIILGACTVVLALFGPAILQVLGSGFDPETMAQCKVMFYITLPAVVVSGVAVIWGATLNSGDRYALAAIAPIAVPLTTIVVLLFTINTLGVFSLAIGLIAGLCIQVGLLGFSLHQHSVLLTPRWQTRQKQAVTQVLHQFLPAVSAAVLISGSELVDQSMAASLGTGSVSALNFGMKLLSFMIAIGSTALSVTALTHFSKMVAASDWIAVRHTFKTYAWLIVAATLPVVFVFTVFSQFIVRALYERGAFTPQDTILVSQVQAAFFLEFPFYLLVTLTTRLLSSLKMQQVFFWGAILNFSLNVTLNYIFIKWFGVAGIALSTSCVYMVSFGFLYLILHRKLRSIDLESAA